MSPHFCEGHPGNFFSLTLIDDKSSEKRTFALHGHGTAIDVTTNRSSSVSLKVTAMLNTWRPGHGYTAIRLVADGKDRARLGAQLSHSLSGGDRAVGLKLNFSQSLFSGVDLALQLTANLSAHRYVRASAGFRPQHLFLFIQRKLVEVE